MPTVVRTSLSHFKIDKKIIRAPVNVEWYKYPAENVISESFHFLDKDDISSFLRFTKGNRSNFPGFPFIFFRSESELPAIDTDKRVLHEEILFSTFLLLGSHLIKNQEAPSWASNALLVSSKRVDVVDDLSFPLIGVVV